jgi:threonine synthase
MKKALLKGLSGSCVGEAFSVTDDRSILGRSSDAAVRLVHASVSRLHARVLRDGERYYLEDVGSSRGTYVNGERVVGRAQIVNGDAIRVGDVSLRFMLVEETEPVSGEGRRLPSDNPPSSSNIGLEDFPQFVNEAITQVRDLPVLDLPPTSTKRAQKQYELECARCKVRMPGRFDTVCACGGMLETIFDLSRARLVDSPNPFVRFADLLPVRDRSIYPRETRTTPTIHAKRLGALVGLPWLYLKNESVHPTGSTKDRASIISLAMLLESGTLSFVTSSTGNAGTAYAYALELPPFASMQMTLFVGEAFAMRANRCNLDRIKLFGLRGGSFVEAGAVGAAYAREHKLLSDGGFFNPAKREGAKLAYFEATDQIPRAIDWYVQSISSGLGVEGTYKGAKELLALGHIRKLPRLLCVQEKTCAPQVQAWEDESPEIEPNHIVHDPTGIALATHRGDPSRAYPYVRASVIDSKGTFTSVTEREIRDAKKLLFDLEGLDVCFNSAMAVAGVLKHTTRGTIDPDQTVLVNLTGRDRTDETPANDITWLVNTDGEWKSADGSICIPETKALRRRTDERRWGAHDKK